MKGLLTNKERIVDCHLSLFSHRVENGSSIRVHTKEHGVFFYPEQPCFNERAVG